MRLTPGGKELMRLLMKQQGLTIEKLADKADCHPATVGHLLTGYRTGCREDTAISIEKILLGKAHKDSELRIFMPRLSRVAGNTRQQPRQQPKRAA